MAQKEGARPGQVSHSALGGTYIHRCPGCEKRSNKHGNHFILNHLSKAKALTYS